MLSPQVVFQIVLLFFVLVTIHEWGHFYFAKRAGILVREFAIGFGPKLFSFIRGETRYTLRLLPIGGFVRMAGEDPEIVHIQPGQTIAVSLEQGRVKRIYLDQLDQRTNVIQGTAERIDLERELSVQLDVGGEKLSYAVHPQAFMIAKGKETQIAPWDRQFGSKTVGQRALSIFAGPFMNFILAFVLYVVVMFLAGMPTNVKIDRVEPDSPALKAGLQAGDVITRVNGTPIGSDPSELTGLIRESANKKMEWTVLRGGKEQMLHVTPEIKEQTALVGVRLTSDKRSTGVGEALEGGWTNMVQATKLILTGFKTLVLGQFTLDDLGGPVRIVEVTSEHASAGLPQYTFWAASMSLYLGIFNLLPFPALDGSRLVFLGFEAVRGRPVDPNRESMVHFVGFAMLMLLMIAVTYNDILRLIKG
ncbi:RIP metalloprotease RseP [Paenibacillus flagellatus]|uniref:Zinc metalloprotease n=1 Tax=Paenibacillus flagellatus TaxID=2211139 RepID=A0A2V5JYS3_9BACL|nr:RIP metalloprotease RseP [Paenibacillus flagellatus]PYI50444.1 RIP metalloprotease RseP [Paenibacillus flagellatus]